MISVPSLIFSSLKIGGNQNQKSDIHIAIVFPDKDFSRFGNSFMAFALMSTGKRKCGHS